MDEPDEDTDLIAARAVNGEAHPTPECCLAFERAMDAFWQAHDRPTGKRPSGKQRQFKPKVHKLKFKEGDGPKKRPLPY